MMMFIRFTNAKNLTSPEISSLRDLPQDLAGQDSSERNPTFRNSSPDGATGGEKRLTESAKPDSCELLKTGSASI
jgi:hypothetical protein